MTLEISPNVGTAGHMAGDSPRRDGGGVQMDQQRGLVMDVIFIIDIGTQLFPG